MSALVDDPTNPTEHGSAEQDQKNVTCGGRHLVLGVHPREEHQQGRLGRDREGPVDLVGPQAVEQIHQDQCAENNEQQARQEPPDESGGFLHPEHMGIPEANPRQIKKKKSGKLGNQEQVDLWFD